MASGVSTGGEPTSTTPARGDEGEVRARQPRPAAASASPSSVARFRRNASSCGS
jgi:hypothetical protein